jgi:nucleobase:cation symporter-1, NCS1 family
MVLQRAPLGRRGSYLPTALNMLQCLGWAIFELIVIATAAGLLCDQLFGFKAVWLWKLVFGVAAGVLALLGPVGFVRRFVRKFAIWAVLASVIYLAWWIVDGANVSRIWMEHGHKGSFWLAVDTVIAVTVSWAPLVADYTRFSRDRRSAFFGVGIGYLLPTLFQFGFGSILVLSRSVDPNRPELILAAIAGGGIAAALALLALTVDETDEAFANVYSSAVSTLNLVPRVPQRALIVGASVVATGGALTIDMRSYQRFLLLLGAVFVPLLGVLLADWLLAGAHYTREHIFDGPAVRPGPIAAWVIGFLVYEWLYQPTDLGFWSRWLGHLPTPSYQIGASMPSFVVAFTLTVLAVALGSARAAARPRREPRARPG